MLDLSEKRCIQKVMGRVKFALINRPFSIVNKASLVYLKKYGSTHSMSNISMSLTRRCGLLSNFLKSYFLDEMRIVDELQWFVIKID